MATRIKTEVVVPRRAEQTRTRLDAVLGASSRRDRGRTSISELHWTPTGRWYRIYPTVDADVAVTAIDDTSCLLTIAGAYQPPLGRFGRLADRAVMHRFAASTATEFADRLSRAL